MTRKYIRPKMETFDTPALVAMISLVAAVFAALTGFAGSVLAVKVANRGDVQRQLLLRKFDACEKALSEVSVLLGHLAELRAIVGGTDESKVAELARDRLRMGEKLVVSDAVRKAQIYRAGAGDDDAPATADRLAAGLAKAYALLSAPSDETAIPPRDRIRDVLPLLDADAAALKRWQDRLVLDLRRDPVTRFLFPEA